jgi:hypothetical protein
MNDTTALARVTAEVQGLRLDAMLNAEIIRTLRAAQDKDAQKGLEDAELQAQISASIHERVIALCAGNDDAGVRGSLEELLAVTGDLMDYAKALAGELVLEREQLNLRHWLSRLECALTAAGRSPGVEIRIRVCLDVPDRVIADPARLQKVLTHLIHVGIDSVHSKRDSFVIELSSMSPTAHSSSLAPEPRPMIFSLLGEVGRPPSVEQSSDHDDGVQSIAPRHHLSPEGRLRAALVEQLCRLMGVTITQGRPDTAQAAFSIIVPMQSSPDQGYTGRFRLDHTDTAIARLHGSAPPPSSPATGFVAVTDDVDDVVDFLYLDRQLGSLATVILDRTTPAFLGQAVSRMTDIYVAHELKDLKRLCRLAHVWKASAMTVGARRFAALLDTIEKQAAAGRLPADGQIVQLRDALDRLVGALEGRATDLGGQRESA